MGCTRPSQELKSPDDADALRVRRPNGEMNSAHARDFAHVRAQFFVVQIVRAFARKIEVVFGEQRRKSVGVIGFEHVAVGEAIAQAIRRWVDWFTATSIQEIPRKDRFKQAIGMNVWRRAACPGCS